MKKLFTDLHLHSPQSVGVSKNMTLPILASQSKLKGLNLLVTGDITNKDWLIHCKKQLQESNSVFTEKETNMPFILGTEVADSHRIHQLVFFPDFSSVEQFRQLIKGKARIEGWGSGRPDIKMTAEKLAELAEKCNAIIGPAHAYTPYFSIYSKFNSPKECYGEMIDTIKFMELGLSADSYYSDLIEANHDFVYLTNSDSHSPWPHRIGREFNVINAKKPSFDELKKVFYKKGKRNLELNVGLDPREGKYHCTACNSCYERYSFDDAIKLGWKCKFCKGAIKKGVKDRILELATFSQETHPEDRADYQYLVPLAEIIMLAVNVASVNSKKVQVLWRNLVESFTSEINVLLDVPIVEIEDIHKETAQKIEAFRKGWVLYVPGGGGNYGKPIICSSREEFEAKKTELGDVLNCGYSKNQKSILEFS